MELGERKLKVLSALIEAYINTGEPVGSKALQEALDRAVSSATIRNDMAELSELGLLEQPHTSAGRVPSPRGYRLYIDKLMSHAPVTKEERRFIDTMLEEHADDPERLLENASLALAQLTRFAALSTTPESETAVILKCELIAAGRRLAILLLVTSAGMMKSKLFKTDTDITPELCERFRRVTAEHVCGVPLSDICLPFVQTLAASLGEHAFTMTPLLIGLYETASEAAQAQVRLEGQANLLIHPEFDGEHVRRLMEFLAKRKELAELLHQYHGGVNVVLGSESPTPELSGSSVVIARYRLGSREGGTIGVIGPSRMNYSKIIPSLEYFALRLGNLLSEDLDEGGGSQADSQQT